MDSRKWSRNLAMHENILPCHSIDSACAQQYDWKLTNHRSNQYGKNRRKNNQWIRVRIKIGILIGCRKTAWALFGFYLIEFLFTFSFHFGGIFMPICYDCRNIGLRMHVWWHYPNFDILLKWPKLPNQWNESMLDAWSNIVQILI